MNVTELFLIAMVVIFAVPYIIWRGARTDYFAPLVVVQIIAGVLLGPGVLGAAVPEYYSQLFTPPVVQALNGIAWWAVMLFVMLAGIELDLHDAMKHRKESVVTAGFALGMPLVFGAAAGLLLIRQQGWIGPKAQAWQFVVGVGMACAVTALPILVLLMEKMGILRSALGQRVLRYASLDDIALWGVLAVILMDWNRVERQLLFLIIFALLCVGFRALMPRLPTSDRWYVAIIWLALVSLGADWCGLHFMVGAFLAGVVMEKSWFNLEQLDQLRTHVLLVMMPVFFLSTGLKTQWTMGGTTVLLAAALLLVASVSGKIAGTQVAARVLGWPRGDAQIVGWLLQTKALIEIIFVHILLDKQIITSEMFTAFLLMAIVSTMLTVPVVTPLLATIRKRPAS